MPLGQNADQSEAGNEMNLFLIFILFVSFNLVSSQFGMSHFGGMGGSSQGSSRFHGMSSPNFNPGQQFPSMNNPNFNMGQQYQPSMINFNRNQQISGTSRSPFNTGSQYGNYPQEGQGRFQEGQGHATQKL